jgi:hypothetical protein
MPQYDWIILMILGGVFILLGIGGIIWGRGEEKGYYDTLSTRSSIRTDVREFIEHEPKYPQFAALKIGGRIALAIGITLLIIGIVIVIRR